MSFTQPLCGVLRTERILQASVEWNSFHPWNSTIVTRGLENVTWVTDIEVLRSKWGKFAFWVNYPFVSHFFLLPNMQTLFVVLISFSIAQIYFIAHAEWLSWQKMWDKHASLRSAFFQLPLLCFIFYFFPPFSPLLLFSLLHFCRRNFSVYVPCASVERSLFIPSQSCAQLSYYHSGGNTAGRMPVAARRKNPNWVERSIFLCKSWNMAVSELLACQPNGTAV